MLNVLYFSVWVAFFYIAIHCTVLHCVTVISTGLQRLGWRRVQCASKCMASKNQLGIFFCDGKCENEILRRPITLQGISHGSGYQRPHLHVSQLNDCEHAGDTPLTVVVFWI